MFSRAARQWNPRTALLVGWAGLRGSITMAAALSLPVLLPDEQPFPQRDLLVFLAAATIVLTLVINGLSLPLIVRALDVPGDDLAARDRHAAEVAVARAASFALKQEIDALTQPEEIAHARGLADAYSQRVDQLIEPARSESHERQRELTRRLTLVAMEAQRRELYALRDAGAINDETVREIESRLDNAELLADDGLPVPPRS
jgi:CPA1 family monovalent cation:H+ antiporter